MQIHIAIKYFFTAIIFLFIVTSTSAQIRITGKIIDTSDNPLTNVNIILLKQNDSSLVKSFVTNSSGAFILENILKGNYILGFSLVGYETKYRNITVPNQSKEISLQPIILQKQIKQLSEVVITAKKPLLELKIDRTIVNVKNSITLAGSNALDALERSPGVLVDRQTNSISMMGKTGIIIMINGKVTNMPAESVVQMLSGLNASSIERIELITTPPANFDSEGNAGIINLVLAKNTMYGTNGTVSASAGYVRNGPITNASIDFNNHSKKGDFYGNLGFSTQDFLTNWYSFRRINSGAQTQTSELFSNRQSAQLNFNGRLSYDYNLGKKSILGAVLSGYSNKFSLAANNEAFIYTNYNLDSFINVMLDETNQWKNLSANLNLLHNFTGDTKITFDLSYQRFNNNQPVDYLNNYFNSSGGLMNVINTISRKTTPINIYVIKADYETKLSKKLLFEAGFKTAFNRFQNIVLVQDKVNNTWKTDTSLSTSANLNENVYAVYTSFSLDLNEKTGIKAGLRYENTNTELTTIDGLPILKRELNNLFPSIFLSREINDDYSFNVSISRRITRPTFNELAPFVFLFDPNTFITGNPGLKPSISYSFSNSWTLKQNTLQISYNTEENAIVRFQPKIDTATGKQIFYSLNLKSINTFATAIIIPLTVKKWWDMLYSFTGQWQQINYFNQNNNFKAEQIMYFIRTTHTFKLPKSFTIEFRYNYNSKSLFGSYETIPVSYLDAGIQKKFKNKMNLSFNVSDLFNSNRTGWDSNQSSEFYTKFRAQFFPRSFRLNFSIPFGNSEIKAARKRKMGSEEENRVE